MELNEPTNRKPTTQSPLFSFGVISDIQYGDFPDGRSFHGNARYYRDALEKTRRAVRHWNEMGDIDFVLQLGDLVDGWNRDKTKEAIDRVLEVMEEFKGRIYHTFGNHELYNSSREYLIKRLHIDQLVHSNKDVAYFSFSPYPGWRIIMLDTFDLSPLGRDANHPHTFQATQILETRNPHKDKNTPPDDPQHKWIVKFNGGIGQRQLEWLDTELRMADTVSEKVMLCSHVPFHPDAAGAHVLVWNYEDVLNLIEKHPSVVACISGHDHDGGYSITHRSPDKAGSFGVVHFCILEAVLESPPGLEAHGRVEVYDDKLELIGFGKLSSYSMPFSLHKNHIVNKNT